MKLLQKMEKSKLLFIEKLLSYLCHGRQIYQNGINKRRLSQTSIFLNELLQILIGKFSELKNF